MSERREMGAHAKDVRHGVKELRPIGTKNGRPRPWKVICSYTMCGRRNTYTVGRYRTEAEAQTVIDQAVRKLYWDNARNWTYRIEFAA